MRLYLSSMKRQVIPACVMGVIYMSVLIVLIAVNNSNSMIYYKITPYIYASEPIDFFFSLIVSIPFSIYTFFMKKDHFLEYVHVRISKKKYVGIHIVSTLIVCFLMIFIVNFAGVIFSSNIADVIAIGNKPTLDNYILGELQMSHPVIFGVLWSLHKSLIGTMICLFAQIFALYVENFFLALIAPFAYVVLENFFTSMLSLSRFSITTSFVLNRLKPESMTIANIAIGSLGFLVLIAIVKTALRSRFNNGKI